MAWRSCRGARHKRRCKTPPPAILDALTLQLLAALGLPASPTVRFPHLKRTRVAREKDAPQRATARQRCCLVQQHDCQCSGIANRPCPLVTIGVGAAAQPSPSWQRVIGPPQHPADLPGEAVGASLPAPHTRLPVPLVIDCHPVTDGQVAAASLTATSGFWRSPR